MFRYPVFTQLPNELNEVRHVKDEQSRRTLKARLACWKREK